MRYPSCLPVAPSVMEVTDPSLETGREEKKNLKKWRQSILLIQETGTKIEQAREEKKIARKFFQKIRNYVEGKGEGVELRLDNIPKLREKWDRMYEWIIVLMRYIKELVGWDVRALRTERMKIVIQKVAGLRERKGTENLTITNKGSGEDYAKRFLDFLEEARAEKRRKEKEEKEKLNGMCQQEYLAQQKRKRK